MIVTDRCEIDTTYSRHDKWLLFWQSFDNKLLTFHEYSVQKTPGFPDPPKELKFAIDVFLCNLKNAVSLIKSPSLGTVPATTPYIPVTAFAQTDLFLILIYLEFRSPQEPQ